MLYLFLTHAKRLRNIVKETVTSFILYAEGSWAIRRLTFKFTLLLKILEFIMLKLVIATKE